MSEKITAVVGLLILATSILPSAVRYYSKGTLPKRADLSLMFILSALLIIEKVVDAFLP